MYSPIMTLHSLQWSFPNSLGKGQTLGNSKTLFLYKIGEYLLALTSLFTTIIIVCVDFVYNSMYCPNLYLIHFATMFNNFKHEWL